MLLQFVRQFVRIVGAHRQQLVARPAALLSYFYLFYFLFRYFASWHSFSLMIDFRLANDFVLSFRWRTNAGSRIAEHHAAVVPLRGPSAMK
jgi:hypothetical protein